MITPWEIYWILQLDNIGTFIGIIIFLGVLVVSIMLISGVMFTSSSKCMPELDLSKEEAIQGKILTQLAGRIFWTILPLIILYPFIPSTKTVATMLIAPKILNSPTVKHEAGDLYNLAKQALENDISQKKSNNPG